MSAGGAKTFQAVLEPDGTWLRWVVARVPFEIAQAWPVRRGRRVRGEINGFAFRTSLFPDPRGAGHIVLVNKKMQAPSAGHFLLPDCGSPGAARRAGDCGGVAGGQAKGWKRPSVKNC